MYNLDLQGRQPLHDDRRFLYAHCPHQKCLIQNTTVFRPCTMYSSPPILGSCEFLLLWIEPFFS